MIARIAKQFTFDAAHFLPGLAPVDGVEHPCSRMHGHTYGVELQLVGPVQPNGFVLDYADIHKAWKHVRDLVDHRTLNDVAGLEQPTTENLAWWLIEKLASHPMFLISLDLWDGSLPKVTRKSSCTLLERVIVKESSTTWCEVLVGAVSYELGKNRVPMPAAETTELYSVHGRPR